MSAAIAAVPAAGAAAAVGAKVTRVQKAKKQKHHRNPLSIMDKKRLHWVAGFVHGLPKGTVDVVFADAFRRYALEAAGRCKGSRIMLRHARQALEQHFHILGDTFYVTTKADIAASKARKEAAAAAKTA
jgi:hypothetical protein